VLQSDREIAARLTRALPGVILRAP
jgi:hypothetical protein